MNIKTVRWWIKNLIGNNYYGFKWIIKPYAKRQALIVNHDTDIVIEGYPRSGNTFAVAAFELAQGKALNIARHRHEAGQVILAAEMEKPILLIIREPLSAVVSLCIREQIDIGYAFKYYIDFYKKLLPLKENIVVVDFKEIITDMGAVIQKVNTRFDTKYQVFEHNNENVKKVKEIISELDRMEGILYMGGEKKDEDLSSRVAFPTESRNKIKSEITNSIISTGQYTVLLEKANNLYRQYIN